MATRLPRRRSARYFERWLIWSIWLAFYIAYAIVGSGFAVWAFMTGHWIIGAVLVAWASLWTARVLREFDVARAFRRLLGRV
jgi:hypothetical protein